jgi:hypothetical protein
MDTVRSQNAHAALISLEAAAASARGGFACMFSTSDEYEMALITERRAQGRYARRRSRWPARPVRRLCAGGGRHGLAPELSCRGNRGRRAP